MTSSQFGTKSFFCNAHYFFGPSWSEVAEQLPDKLSGSEIPVNSSGIKNDFCSIWAEVKNSERRFQLVDKLATGGAEKSFPIRE